MLPNFDEFEIRTDFGISKHDRPVSTSSPAGAIFLRFLHRAEKDLYNFLRPGLDDMIPNSAALSRSISPLRAVGYSQFLYITGRTTFDLSFRKQVK